MSRQRKLIQKSLFGDDVIVAVRDIEDATKNISNQQNNEFEQRENLNNTNVIKNISYDQKEILWNIMKLYNSGNAFECDITASKLGFYKQSKKAKFNIPEPKYLFDVFPQQEKIKKIEPFGRIPLEDNSVSSIVIDLPFVVSPPNAPSAKSNKKGSMIIFNRFHAYYPVDELYKSVLHWISEAYRVLKEDGICVFKSQSTISGGVQHNSEEYSFMCAQTVGFTGEDKFYLLAKSRLISSGKIKKQAHARKYTSVFWVFKKTLKKKSKNFNYMELLPLLYEEEKNRKY